MQLNLKTPYYQNILSFTDIPEILTWLVSQQARLDFMERMNDKFRNESELRSNNKELNFTEIVSITRVSPAKSLGLGSIKGNLSIGADGDMNILDLNLEETDITSDVDLFKKAFSNIEYVIKSGEIVKKQDTIDFNLKGSIFWSEGKAKVENEDLIMSKKKDFYQKYSSLFYDSYKTTVEEKFLRRID